MCNSLHSSKNAESFNERHSHTNSNKSPRILRNISEMSHKGIQHTDFQKGVSPFKERGQGRGGYCFICDRAQNEEVATIQMVEKYSTKV